MDELFEKSLRTLELPRVLEKLAAQATSEAAKAKARALLPQTDVEDVKRLQQETSAACMLLGLQGSPSFAGAKDVSAALGRAQRGGMLNTRELLDIAALLRCARRVKDYRGDESDRDTVLDTMFRALHGGRFLEDRITRAIPEENEIADNASAELADIRRHMHAAGARSRQILQKIISSPTYSKALQESLITQRDGRFVVPVKAECRSEVRDWFTTCRLRAPRCLSNRWVWCRPTMNSRSWKPKRKKRSSGFCFCFPKRRQPCRKIFYGTTTCWCSWI